MDIAALVEAIIERPGPTRLVAIDAPGGAGKSTFAAQLASAANGAPVVHTDDFASDANPTDWWPRMLTQVIEPLARGDAAVYQRANGSPESIAEWHTVEPAPIVIIEGVSAARSEWSEHLSFIIWIETPRDERLRRGLERDGPQSIDDWESWMTGEDAHYARDPTRQRADVVIDGHSIRIAALPNEGFEIVTERLVLRPWQITDRSEFADMNADVEVMADLGGPLSTDESDAKLQRFSDAFETHGITRWVVTDQSGRFLGYCGIVPSGEDHPLGAHDEIGWRFRRSAWGHGYATEAATAALADAFERRGSLEVLAYTAASNLRSQRVMERLGLRRDPSLDFTQHYDGFGMWNALVWVASPDGNRSP